MKDLTRDARNKYGIIHWHYKPFGTELVEKYTASYYTVTTMTLSDKSIISRQAEAYFIQQVQKHYAEYLHLFEDRLPGIVRGRDWRSIKIALNKEIAAYRHTLAQEQIGNRLKSANKPTDTQL